MRCCSHLAVLSETVLLLCDLRGYLYMIDDLQLMCAAGYGAFLTGWGKPSLAKTLLRPVITLSSYWLGHQALADNFLVCRLPLQLHGIHLLHAHTASSVPVSTHTHHRLDRRVLAIEQMGESCCSASGLSFLLYSEALLQQQCLWSEGAGIFAPARMQAEG